MSLDWTISELSHQREEMGKVTEGIKEFLVGRVSLGEI